MARERTKRTQGPSSKAKGSVAESIAAWLHDWPGVKGLYEALSDEKKRDIRFQAQIHGTFLHWPKEPMHLIDFDKLPGLTFTPKAD